MSRSQAGKPALEAAHRSVTPSKNVHNGVTYDSRHEADWARTFDALGIEYAATGTEALDRGLGGWLPDFALPRAGGGQVWVEVKPVKTDVSLFSIVRAKLECASRIDRDTDALLFLDALPTPGKPFGRGAVHVGRHMPTWAWGAVWYWQLPRPGGGAGLMYPEAGIDLLMKTPPPEAVMGSIREQFDDDTFERKPDGTAGFNPLSKVRVNTEHDIADARSIATILVDPEGTGRVSLRGRIAREHLAAVILHICYKGHVLHERPGTLAEVAEFLSTGGWDENLNEMHDYPHRPGGTPHPMIHQEAKVTQRKGNRELSSVVSTALSYVTLFRDPAIMANAARSDWRVPDGAAWRWRYPAPNALPRPNCGE